jgi:hypothetical protein
MPSGTETLGAAGNHRPSCDPGFSGGSVGRRLPDFSHNHFISESIRRLSSRKGLHIRASQFEDPTMTNKQDSLPPENLSTSEGSDLNEEETENEEELDDGDYRPSFIRRLMDNPPLLPSESRDEFWQVCEAFEYSHTGRAKTVVEHVMVYSAAVLTWEVMRYHRMKIAIMRNQQRPALESLFRKTHDGAAMEGVTSGLRISANLSAKEWFADSASRAISAKGFEAAGYGPDAVEGEAFQQSLGSLATIENLIVSAQKRLMVFMKDLESRYGSRAAEMRITSLHVIANASRPSGEA